MIDYKTISIRNHKGSEQDYIDKVDLAIRVLLNMCRQLKQRTVLRNKVLRNLGTKEKARVSLVLEKLQLPPELMEGDMDEGLDSLVENPLVSIHCHSPLALEDQAPVNPGPSKKAKSQEDESFVGMINVPSIFSKILNRQAPAQPVAQGSLSDEQIIAQAMAYQPVESLKEPKVKKTKNPKKTESQKEKKKKKQPATKAKKKNSSKKASQTKDPPEKKKSKAKTQSAPPPTPEAEEQDSDKDKVPHFEMELKPRETDTYKNQYASRQHHKAFNHAMKWGKSKEEASTFARSFSKRAREIWDNLNPS